MKYQLPSSSHFGFEAFQSFRWPCFFYPPLRSNHKEDHGSTWRIHFCSVKGLDILVKLHLLNCIKYMVLFPIIMKKLWYFFLLYRKMYKKEKVPMWYFFLRKKYHTPLGTFSHRYFFLVFNETSSIL